MPANHLVSVRRPDRNGRVQTRWVKGDHGSSSGQRAIPGPAAAAGKKPVPSAAEKEAAAAAKRLGTPRSFKYDLEKWHGFRPSSHLLPYLRMKVDFTATDDDFYAVLEHFTLEDTIVVLSSSPHFAAKAREVSEKGMKFELASADNRELVGELRSRGIVAKDFVKLAREHPALFRMPMSLGVCDDWTRKLLDLTEYRAHASARSAARAARETYGDSEVGTFLLTFDEHVRHGTVRLADLKTVGMEMCHYMIADFRPVLERMAAGESQCTAEELAGVLAPVSNDHMNQKARAAILARLADRHGAAFASSLADPITAFYAESAAKFSGDRDRERSFLRFYDAIAALDDWGLDQWAGDPVPIEGALAMWEADVPVEVVRASLDSGMDARQILAVHAEGIAPGVSGGWL